MRAMLFTVGFGLFLAGCRSLEQARPAQPETHLTQRLPATVDPAAPALASPATDNLQEVQPAQHTEPANEPETLPPQALKPSANQPLTLADLEHMALSFNPSIARAAAQVQAARGNWLQVGLAPNPSAGYEGQQIGSGGLAEQDGVFVQQEFVRGGKLRLSRETAAREISKAQFEFDAQQQRVLTDVRIAYYQVLIAQQQEMLTLELRNIAAESMKVAEALRKGEEVGRVDVVQAQLEVENADILMQNAKNRCTAAWQSLSAVIGNPHLPVQMLAGNLEESYPVHDWDATLGRLLNSSPEISAATAEIARTRAALDRASVEAVPNLTIQGLMNWRDEGIGGKPDGAVTVGLPLPLWNRNQGGIAEAQGNVTAAQRSFEQLQLSLQNRLAPVFERYASALNQVNKYRHKILPAAKESLELNRQLYRAGETNYVNLLTAQRTFSQTNLNYLESLRELRFAEAQIDGLLLSDSLQSQQ